MILEYWVMLFGLLSVGILIVIIKRWVVMAPIWFCNFLAVIGLLVGIFFFAWMTRILGTEVAIENYDKANFVRLANELRTVRTRNDTLITASRIKDILERQEKPVPPALNELVQMALDNTPGVIEKARVIHVEHMLDAPIKDRNHTRGELFFFFLNLPMFGIFLSVFGIHKSSRRRRV